MHLYSVEQRQGNLTEHDMRCSLEGGVSLVGVSNNVSNNNVRAVHSESLNSDAKAELVLMNTMLK